MVLESAKATAQILKGKAKAIILLLVFLCKAI
jgi:hypothetical protein